MEQGRNEVRVQKYVADCGLMSRRKAEEEILAGRIKVNGERVEQGRKIVPGVDRVEYLGRPVEQPNGNRFVYIMLNKPRGYVTTMNDELGRKCVASLVEDVGCRVYPCGRLDLDSEGLLILTNDGALANKLMHPSHHIPKLYTVKVKGKVTEQQLQKLNRPMIIDGYETQPAVAKILSMKEEETAIGMTLFEGRNRQIRKMCEQLSLTVLSLKRIAMGSITLGNLKSGTWKRLSRTQVEYLKNYK
ncbi:MAG: rRNA pseudouridine synthase [Ruminococcaceae bacterium]|nr:rRNA pseudouridine synthase [Oscillospiraceae bacterium]